MLITPPELAWGCSVLESCWPLLLGAWRHPLQRHLLVCGFTLVGLLHCLAMVRTGRLVPPLRPILAFAGRLACRSTAPTLQFLYSEQARSTTFESRRDSGAVRRCLHPGEPGSLCIPARACRPWSAVRLAAKTAPADRRSAGGSYRLSGRPRGQTVPRRGCCATRGSCSSRPSRPATMDSCPGARARRAPAQAPQPHHAPQAMKLWLRDQLRLSG
jgi:hypothetical protein